MSGCLGSAFNPLAELDLESPDIIDDATMFADALITHPERGEKHYGIGAIALARLDPGRRGRR